MLVVDRRGDQTAYAPGANRAEVQVELDLYHVEYDPLESTALSVQAPGDLQDSGRGVACIIETPGPEVLLQILLQRVWGVFDHPK
jgi:hypothetical protein